MTFNIPHYQTDYYKGILGVYNRRILKHVIKMGELKNARLILDFGCGAGHLKKRVQNVVGYDINPDLSDVDDYKNLKPDKIVAAASLQYLNPKQMDAFLSFCIKNKAELITVIPTENVFAKIAMIVLRKSYAHDDHIFKYEYINKMIERYYKIEERKYLWFGMAQLTKYKLKS